ncbi:hypothetical protein FZO89_17970 [Luteimonas viscosa]|uniref:Secreted protein n=2 Tax=Luteimonas viscosa TaxID=1132694 RepID=A0A5D4XEM6_9GAMM|nr:hypothetical protein FZO89_17970 [Luteimonas viscosa]
MRLRSVMFALCLVLGASACAPRATSVPSGTPGDPAPPVTSPALPATPGVPDASCRIAGDCAVKNVGNCCGYFPACVNKDSPIDPDAVRAQCERSGMSSVCGWKDIQACDCVQGRCQAVDGPIRVDR